MTTMVDAAISTADWDDAVSGFPDANVYQTSHWASAKGPRTSARRVLIRDGHQLTAGAQLLLRRLGPAATAAYVPYGPLVAEDHRCDAAVADRTVEAIETEAERAGCSVLFIQPARGDTTTAPVLESRGFRPAPVAVATTATLEVELGLADDELFARLAKTRRSAVRRSGRKGVVIEQGGDRDLDTLLRLHVASAQRHGFLPMSDDYLHRQWQALHGAGHLRLFLARLGGKVRAAGTVVAFGPYAEFKLTGWDGSDEARQAFVNEAINWAMMSWANGAGFQYFDLGGLPRAVAMEALLSDASSVIRGTGSEFKLGWGGRVAVYPDTYEKVLRPSGHLTYRLPSKLLDDRGLGGRVVNWMRRT